VISSYGASEQRPQLAFEPRDARIAKHDDSSQWAGIESRRSSLLRVDARSQTNDESSRSKPCHDFSAELLASASGSSATNPVSPRRHPIRSKNVTLCG
jgi:hypothetical protein